MMKLLHRTHSRGFTMVETLVYIFLFSLLSAGAITMLISLNDLFVQYKLKQDLLNSGTVAMERILTEVREADEVLLLKSEIASSTAGTLTLVHETDEISIRKNSDQLELYKNDIFETSLHTDSVEIEGATFYYYIENGIELVRIRLDLMSTQGSQTERWSVTGGSIIRGTYENT